MNRASGPGAGAQSHLVNSMQLVWPARDYLAPYVAALERGWSQDNLRREAAAREELAHIAADPDAFLASLVDREAAGDPITLPDGTTVPRLPGYRQWMWDGRRGAQTEPRLWAPNCPLTGRLMACERPLIRQVDWLSQPVSEIVPA